MLLRAPIGAVKAGTLNRRSGFLMVVMRHYPRYTPKTLIDEYCRDLAPEAELFAEFKVQDRTLKDHNAAFELVRYEERFAVTAAGHERLEALCARAQARDVYLICQCTHDQRCHCDLLLLYARHHFDAVITQLPFDYPVFAARLSSASGVP